MERMLHSVLTSRVLLHIRAQTEDNLGWSDELTDLIPMTFERNEVECSGREHNTRREQITVPSPYS